MREEPKLKIAQVAPIAFRIPPRLYGGTELVVSLLTEELVKIGHDVTLFATLDSKTSAKLDGIFEKPIGLGPEGLSNSLLHFGCAFKKAEEFDVIHNHGGMYGLTYVPFVKTPVLTTFHNVYFEPGTSSFNHYINFGKFVTISKAQKKYMGDHQNIVGSIYNAINISKYRYEEKKEDYLLWFGNICEDKGTDIAIEVAEELGMKIIIAGMLDQSDGERVEYFEKKVKPKINGKKIINLCEVSNEKKYELMSKAKCLLSPLQWEEPFGLVMIEAMASGTPVIVFRRGSSPEVVVNGMTGFVVDSFEEMVAGVKKINEIDPKACRKHVEDNFTPKVMAENYIKMYNKILGK